MSDYTPFRGEYWAISEMRKLGIINSGSNYKQMLDTIIHNYGRTVRKEDLMELGQSISGIFFEAVHYFLSHRVYQLTKNLTDCFMKSSLRLTINDIKIEHSTFELSFHKDFRIPNTHTSMPGVMCGILNEKMSKVHLLRIRKDLAKREFEINRKISSMGVMWDNPMLYISTGCLESEIIWKNRVAQNIRQMGSIELSSILNRPIEDILKEYSERWKTNSELLVGLRIALATLCFLQLKQPEIEKVSNFDHPLMGNRADVSLLGRDCIACAFMRAAHFRTLVNERYHRDAMGYPRIIWVREHMVNRDGVIADFPKSVIKMGDDEFGEL